VPAAMMIVPNAACAISINTAIRRNIPDTKPSPIFAHRVSPHLNAMSVVDHAVMDSGVFLLPTSSTGLEIQVYPVRLPSLLSSLPLDTHHLPQIGSKCYPDLLQARGRLSCQSTAVKPSSRSWQRSISWNLRFSRVCALIIPQNAYRYELSDLSERVVLAPPASR
jgi:hypothetical protein